MLPNKVRKLGNLFPLLLTLLEKILTTIFINEFYLDAL